MTRLLLAALHARESLPGVLVAAALVWLVLWRAERDARLAPGTRRAVDAIVLAATVVMGVLTCVDVVAAVKWYRPWDFPSFYAVARAAVEHRDVYDPNVLAEVQAGLGRAAGVPGEWLSEAGYWYLPPSLFTIAPLGALAYRAALLVQYASQLAFLAGAALLLHRRRPLFGGVTGFAGLLLLLLLFRPVQATVYFAQVVFGALFFLVLAENLAPRSGWRAGLGLAAGFLYKHTLLIPGALLVASVRPRQRSVVLGLLAGLGVAMGASALVFGPRIFADYAAHGPGDRSESLAVDPVVQSLLALVYRALHATPHGSLLQIILYPPFLVAAGLMTLVTVVLLRRRGGLPDGPAWWLVSALAVTCYPNTLLSTLALLVPAMLGAWQLARERAVPFVLRSGILAGLFVLSGAAPALAGWSAVIVWAGLVALGAERSPA